MSRCIVAATLVLVTGCSIGTPYLRDLVEGEEVAGLAPFWWLDGGDAVRAKLSRSAERGVIQRGGQISDYAFGQGFAEGDLVDVEWYSESEGFRLVVGKPRFPSDAADAAAQARFLGITVGDFVGVLSAPSALDPGPVRLYATSAPEVYVTKRGDRIERILKRPKPLAHEIAGKGTCWTDTYCNGGYTVLVTKAALLGEQLKARLAADAPRARAWAKEAELDRVPEYAELLDQQRKQTLTAFASVRGTVQAKWAASGVADRLTLFLGLEKAIRALGVAEVPLDQSARKEALAWRAELATGLLAAAREAADAGRFATAARLAGLSAKLQGKPGPKAATLAEALQANPSDPWALAQHSLARAALSAFPLAAPGAPKELAEAARAAFEERAAGLKAWGLSLGDVAALAGRPEARAVRIAVSEPESGLREQRGTGWGTSSYEVRAKVPNPAHAEWQRELNSLAWKAKEARAAYDAEVAKPADYCWSSTTYHQETYTPQDNPRAPAVTVAVADRRDCSMEEARKQLKVDQAAKAYDEVATAHNNLVANEPPKLIDGTEKASWRYSREEQRWTGEVRREVRFEGPGIARGATQRESGEKLLYVRQDADSAHGVRAASEFKQEPEVRALLVKAMEEKWKAFLAQEWGALVAGELARLTAGSSEEERLLQRLVLGGGKDAPVPDPLTYAPVELDP